MILLVQNAHHLERSVRESPPGTRIGVATRSGRYDTFTAASSIAKLVVFPPGLVPLL